MNQQTANATRTLNGYNNRSRWIIHPCVDLLFCCGAIVWLILLLNAVGFQIFTSSTAQVSTTISIFGAIALSETHIAATMWRTYRTSKRDRSLRLYAITVTTLSILVALSGCLVEQLIPVYLKIYLLWISQHFTAQTFGISMIYLAKHGYSLAVAERQCLSMLMHATTAVAMLRQLTWQEWSSNTFLGFQLPFWGPLPEWICQLAEWWLAASVLALVYVINRKWRRDNQLIPLPAALLIFTGTSIFNVSRELADTLWIYAPALFHGSQYLAVTLVAHLKENSLVNGSSRDYRPIEFLGPPTFNYAIVLLVAAWCLFHGLPAALGVCGLKVTVVTASIFAAVQFHHFLLDCVIWKLRKPQLLHLFVD